MTVKTKDNLLRATKQLFALNGYEGFSMRILSDHTGIGLSSIYHFFTDKDALLKEVFDQTNTHLGIERAKLPHTPRAADMLKSRIQFQFENMEEVVFVLKYFLHFRKQFKKLPDGYVPPKAYLHIKEVLEHGIETGEFIMPLERVDEEAKVITHAINGYLLEYFPRVPKESELPDIITPIQRFLLRSLTNKEVVMQ